MDLAKGDLHKLKIIQSALISYLQNLDADFHIYRPDYFVDLINLTAEVNNIVAYYAGFKTVKDK